MKILILLLLLIPTTSCLLLAQETPPPPPPPPAMCSEENKPLIDKLVELCDYEYAFNGIRDSIINEHSKDHYWDENKIQLKKKEISYSNINSWMFYNAYSKESKKELEDLISFYSSLSKRKLYKTPSRYKRMILKNFENRINGMCEH